MSKARQRAGRVRVDITAAASGDIQVTVTRACDNPKVLELVDKLLEDIVRRQPGVTIKQVEPEHTKRGGPVGMPQDQRLQIVRGWFKVQGRMKEAMYAQSQGISSSTLRRWIRDLRQVGKL